MSIDLLGAVGLDKVDLVGGTRWELETADIDGALGDIEVAEEEVVQRGLRSLVGEVDIDGGGISGDGGPGDLVADRAVPEGAGGGRGDGDGLGYRGESGEGEDGVRRHGED